MKVSSRIHGIIDYLSVAFLWLSPTMFDLPEVTSNFTYILGGIHLLLTILTNFELGIIKIVPLKIHSIIELLVALGLFGVAFILGNMEGSLARNFYLAFAFILLIFWYLTEYKAKEA